MYVWNASTILESLVTYYQWKETSFTHASDDGSEQIGIRLVSFSLDPYPYK